MTKHNPPIETMDPAEVARLLHAGKLLLIDVREPAAYSAERRLAAGRAHAAHSGGGIAAWRTEGLPVIAFGSTS